jgi:hypothetical protein
MIFFLNLKLSHLFKIYKSYLFTLKKVIYCIPPRGGMVHRERALHENIMSINYHVTSPNLHM